MNRFLIVVVLCSALLHATPAFAIPITWTFTGELTRTTSFSDLAFFFPAGAPTVYSLTFDPDAFGDDDYWRSCPTGGIGCSLAGDRSAFDFSATIAGHDYFYSGARPFGRWDPDTRHFSIDTSITGASVGGAPLIGPTFTIWPVALDFRGLLPTESVTSPGLASFELYIGFHEWDSAGPIIASGQFDAVQVPTPSALLLVALGVVLSGSRRLVRAVRSRSQTHRA